MTAEQRQEISDWVDAEREHILSDLQELARIDSVTAGAAPATGAPFGPGVRRALDWMLEKGRSFGLQAENLDGYCGTLSLGEGEETIGLFSHLDVVPADGDWSVPPFSAKRTADFLIGRGVADNKGPAVAVLYLLKYLSSRAGRPRHRILQYLGCQEENGMRDIEYFLKKRRAPALSVVPDLAFPLCYAEKGMLSFRFVVPFASGRFRGLRGGSALNIVPASCRVLLPGEARPAPGQRVRAVPQGDGTVWTAEGKSAHSAFPQGSVNAIGVLLRALAGLGSLPANESETLRALAELAEDCTGRVLHIAEASEKFGDLTCVFARVDQREDALACDFNVRYPHYLAEADLLGALRAFAAARGWAVERLEGSAGCCFPKEHPAAAVFVRSYEAWVGSHAAPFTTGGGTYARRLPCAFAAGLGIPDVKSKIPAHFPPGHGGAHQPDEALEIEPFFLGVKLLFSAVADLDALDLPRFSS